MDQTSNITDSKILAERLAAAEAALSEIAEILDLYEKTDGGAAQLSLARRKFAERIALLEGQQADIEESLSELRLGLTMIDNKLAERHEDMRTQPRIRLTGYGVMPAED